MNTVNNLPDLPKDLKTRALVLRRTNYGEADRIINLITPVGKISAIVKGARKEKSKLAGGVEMFTLAEVNLHFGRTELATVTGAKMVKFYGEILKDLSRMEKASEWMKKISRASEMIETAEFFEILDKSLAALNDGVNADLIETWFLFNLSRAIGEQVNLYTDASGEKLKEDARYMWDMNEMVLALHDGGEIDANAIKIMRLMWSADIAVVRRIKNIENYVPEILKIAQAVNKVVK